MGGRFRFLNYIEWETWYYCKLAKYNDQPKPPLSCYKTSYEHPDLQNIAFFSFVNKKVTITSFSMLLNKCQFMFTVYIQILLLLLLSSPSLYLARLVTTVAKSKMN